MRLLQTLWCLRMWPRHDNHNLIWRYNHRVRWNVTFLWMLYDNSTPTVTSPTLNHPRRDLGLPPPSPSATQAKQHIEIEQPTVGPKSNLPRAPTASTHRRRHSMIKSTAYSGWGGCSVLELMNMKSTVQYLWATYNSWPGHVQLPWWLPRSTYSWRDPGAPVWKHVAWPKGWCMEEPIWNTETAMGKSLASPRPSGDMIYGTSTSISAGEPPFEFPGPGWRLRYWFFEREDHLLDGVEAAMSDWRVVLSWCWEIIHWNQHIFNLAVASLFVRWICNLIWHWSK